MASEAEVLVGAPVYGGGFQVGDGIVLFVLPGELVMLDPEVRVVEASGSRVAPGCVHFGVCGGCQYQHAEYGEQTRLKVEILRGLLGGLGELPEFGVHTGAEWGYRNRVRLRVNGGEVGYSRRGSNEFLPVTMCPISAPVLWRAAEAIRGLRDALSRRWMTSIAEIELFCTGDEGRVQAQFFLRDSEPAHGDAGAFGRFCEGLKAVVPELVGASAMLDPELSRRARRAWDGAEWGVAGIAYRAAGRSYWVGRGAFFQVNRFLVDELVGLVCGGLSGKVAWDLFAGVGLFTRALAEKFESVVAVEGGEAAAAALAVVGKAEKGVKAVRSSTLDFLREQEFQRDRPEVVVLDPPRAGLGAEGAGILARIGAAEVVYVSCDPVTLARDLAVLTREVYQVERVDLVDLFPQTFHLETVVRLRRRRA